MFVNTLFLAGLGRKIESKAPGAEVLARFFTEKFQIPGEESAVVPHLENEDFMTELKTFRVKRNRVQQVLEKLDESKSVGLDGVSPRVLKQCATVLSCSAPDTTVCKEWDLPTIMEGRKSDTYPQKRAFYFTLQLLAISVLPTLSTTFERVLLSQLSRWLLQYICSTIYVYCGYHKEIRLAIAFFHSSPTCVFVLLAVFISIHSLKREGEVCSTKDI